MSLTVKGHIESAGLARVANNALAHFPANSQVKAARVRFTAEGLEILSTDSYTAGRDSWPWAQPYTFPDVTFEVNRETLSAWDSAGRKDKKGIGLIEFRPGDGSIYYPFDHEVPNEAHPDVTGSSGIVEGTWEALDGMLADTEPDDFKTAFQPGLLQRFAKIKADKESRVADLNISDPNAPVLIKIGPTSVGLIMPVNRDKHSAELGDSEGLW